MFTSPLGRWHIDEVENRDLRAEHSSPAMAAHCTRRRQHYRSHLGIVSMLTAGELALVKLTLLFHTSCTYHLHSTL